MSPTMWSVGHELSPPADGDAREWKPSASTLPEPGRTRTVTAWSVLAAWVTGSAHLKSHGADSVSEPVPEQGVPRSTCFLPGTREVQTLRRAQQEAGEALETRLHQY